MKKKTLILLLIITLFSTTLATAVVPSINNISPTIGETNISINPTLSVTVSDVEGDAMDIDWYWWNYTSDWFNNDSDYTGFYKINMQHGMYANNKTFVCFGGGDAYTAITYYNHTSGIWNDTCLVSNPGTGKQSPSMFINDSGYIWLYSDFHGGDNDVYSSKEPYEIGTSVADWNAEVWPLAESQESYIHALNVGNDVVYIFYRTYITNYHRPWMFIKSTDGGNTWSGSTEWWDSDESASGMGEGYFTGFVYENMTGYGKIHVAGEDSTHNGEKADNVYYMYFNTSNEHIYNVTNNDLGTKINTDAEMNSVMAYNSSSSPLVEETYRQMLDINSNGYPYILFGYGTVITDGINRFCWNITYWNGTAWKGDPAKDNAPWNITGADAWYDGTTGEIKIWNDTDISLYVSLNVTGTGVNGAGGDIQEFKYNVTSGGWSLNRTILTEALRNRNFIMGAKIYNGLENFTLLACEYIYPGAAGADKSRLYGWGRSGNFIKGNRSEWHLFASNNNINNETCIQTNANFSELNKIYHWGVNVSDGSSWTNESFYFRTGEGNNMPIQTNQLPIHKATGISISISAVSLKIEDINGDLFNWTIQGTFITNTNANDASNGTKNANVISTLNYGQTYTWYVNATNGYGWVNETYTFTTETEQEESEEPALQPPTDWAGSIAYAIVALVAAAVLFQYLGSWLKF